MYVIWTTAKSLALRPSDLIGIPDIPDNDVVRFEIDSAVAALGRYIDNKLEEFTEGADKKMVRKYKSPSDVIALLERNKTKKPSKVKPKTENKFNPPRFKRKNKK